MPRAKKGQQKVSILNKTTGWIHLNYLVVFDRQIWSFCLTQKKNV